MLKRTITVLMGIFLAIIFLGRVEGAKAADAGKGVTIIPPSFELYANPGENISDKIRVRNDSGSEVSYQVLVEDFKAVGEEGSVDLIDDTQPNTTYSLAKWVIPEPRSFTLAANQEKEIPFSINVPKDAEPGGHYCSVLFQIGGGDPKAAGGGASVASRVGSLILLRVSGNVKEDASVESFSTAQKYYEKGKVNFDLRVKDNGNNHIKPKGTIVITNIFGQKVAEVQLNGLNALPGAIRKMSTEWNPKNTFLASRYTATLVATYGQQNKSLSATTSFIVFPKYLIYIIAVVLLVIIGLVVGRKRIRQALHKLTK